MILEGRKVRLRPLSNDDLDVIMEWVNDNEVTRTLKTGRYPISREAEREWIEEHTKISPDQVTYAVETLAGEYLGGCSLFRIHPVEHHAELGIVIGRRNQWGRGYATEAMKLLVAYGFAQLNLHLIYLHVIPENKAAVKLYRNLGFTREGVLRDRIYRDGKYQDLIVMSVRRKEWETSPI